MHKYTIIHTRSTYTNVHRYVTSGNVYVTGYRITPVMQGQLSPMNDAYITGNALPDILILHTPTRPTHKNVIFSENIYAINALNSTIKKCFSGEHMPRTTVLQQFQFSKKLYHHI